MQYAHDDDDGDRFIVHVVAFGVRDGGVEPERSDGWILRRSSERRLDVCARVSV